MLRFLRGPPFEPLSSCSLSDLTLKVLFLVSLAMACRVGELQVVSRDVSFSGSDIYLSYLPLFADDTVVVADSERKLCQLVTEFGRVCERRKLRVNLGKSKFMRCTRNEDGARLNVMLNGEALEEVDQFKYLGSVIAGNGGVEADVHHRVNEGCKVLKVKGH